MWEHANERNLSRAKDHSFLMKRDVPRRRLALHGAPCLQKQSSAGPVYECKQPWQGDHVTNATNMVGLLEFRVDLGRLGQDLVGAAKMRGANGKAAATGVPTEAVSLPQQIKAWLTFASWARGVDISELVMDPELADDGAVAEDQGGWTWGVGESEPEASEALAANKPKPVVNATNYVPRADDPRMALLRAEQALLVKPARPTPTKRFVQVWKRLLSETPSTGRIISRLAEHFVRTGGSGIMAYVPSSIGKHLIADPDALPFIERGILQLVRWDDVMHPYSWYDYDQIFMSTHASLSHWGRNAIVFLTDIDEILALPSHEGPTHDWEVDNGLRGAADDVSENSKKKAYTSKNGYARKSVAESRAKTAEEKRMQARSWQANTDTSRGARGRRKMAHSQMSLGRLLSHLQGEGFYSHAGRSSLLDLVADGRPLQSPGDTLPPLAPRQRRLGDIYGPGGCLHRTLQRHLRNGRNPIAENIAVPRCGSVGGYIVMLNGTAEAAETAALGIAPTWSGGADVSDSQRVADAPTTYDALHLPFWAPRGYCWSKPAVDPDGVSSIGVHGVTMCTGPRTQAWGRPPPGGIGVPLPMRRLPNGKWNLTDVGLPMELSTDGPEPPAIESPCKFMMLCTRISEQCIQQRHLGNFHVKRTDRWEKRIHKDWEPASQDWLWVWEDDDLSRPTS